jgi:1,4-dihydroxy-2-naphthoyl-CoA synthase
MLPLAGYSIGGGQTWGQTRYDVTVTGENTSYNSRAQVSVGLGYGPIEMSTISR